MNKGGRALIYAALLAALSLTMAMRGPAATWSSGIARAARGADPLTRAARTSGCGQPSPVTPGASANLTIPALPASGRRVTLPRW